MALHGRFSGRKEKPGRRSQSERSSGRLAPSAPPTIDIAPILHGFTIVWSPADSPIPIAGYRVYRRDGERLPTLVGSPAPDVRSFIDLDVEVDRCYSYFVTAVNFLGEGLPSEEVMGKVDGGRPTISGG